MLPTWRIACAALCVSLATAQPITTSLSSSPSPSSASSSSKSGGKAPSGFIKAYNGRFVSDDCTEFIFTGFDM